MRIAADVNGILGGIVQARIVLHPMREGLLRLHLYIASGNIAVMAFQAVGLFGQVA